jgi:WD40 repeat protein
MPTMMSSTAPANATFGESRFHTDSEVLAVSFGRDGLLYSMEESGFLRQWQPESREQIKATLLSDLETLWAFNSDCQVLASASDDLTVWDTRTGQVLTSIQQPSWVSALAFHPDPTYLATGHDDGTIGYWDAPGYHAVFPRGLLFHRKAISALAISPNGKLLAAASEDKTISLWDLGIGKYIGCLAGHTDHISGLAWHPSGNYVVSAGWDTTARVWDAHTLQPVVLLNSHATQVHALTFSKDGQWLACADSSSVVRLWEFDTKKCVREFTIPAPEIHSLTFSHDGKFLACNGDRMLYRWNPHTPPSDTDFGFRPVAKTTVSLAPDGASLLSNGGGEELCIWNTATGQSIASLAAADIVQVVAFSPDGQRIAGGIGNRVRVWDSTGKHIADWDGPEENITALAFSPDSSLLATGGAEGVAVWIWRVADGEPVLLIPDALEQCTIESLAFLPDNRTLAVTGIDWMATGGSDGAIGLWDIPERAQIATVYSGATVLAVHPSGGLIAAATLDHAICLWDSRLNELQRELVGHEGAVTALAFSPDGAWLASASDDMTLRIWDMQGNECSSWDLDSLATSLHFAPDGKSLYTGNANTTCTRFKLPETFFHK